MPDSVTALSALAVSAFRDRNNPNAMIEGVVREVFAEPDLIDRGHKDARMGSSTRCRMVKILVVPAAPRMNLTSSTGSS